MVKARYTPLQPIVLGVDEEASPHRAAMVAATDLGRYAGGHRRPALGAAGDPGRHPCYAPGCPDRVRDDRRRRAAGLVLPLARRRCATCSPARSPPGRRSAAIWRPPTCTRRCSPPGTCWTPTSRSWRRARATSVPGTTWGFSGTAVGEAVNAAVALGGQPVGSLRISDADGRDRHRGISHHSMTAYGRVALAAADLVVPRGLAGTAGVARSRIRWPRSRPGI